MPAITSPRCYTSYNASTRNRCYTPASCSQCFCSLSSGTRLRPIFIRRIDLRFTDSLRLSPSGCQRSDRHQVRSVRIIVAAIPRVSHPRSTSDIGSLPSQMFKHKAHRQYNLPLSNIQSIARICAQAGPQYWAPAPRAWWPWVSE